MNRRRTWKSATFSAAVLMAPLLTITGCLAADDSDVVRVAATVVQENGQYLLVADSSGTRIIPSRMPFSYRENGLRVYVSGRTVDTLAAGNTPEILLEITSLSQQRGL